MRYRRTYVDGGTYFFTVNLENRQSTVLVDHIALLRDAVAAVKSKHPFNIDAAVVMPEHLHMIWTLPVNESDFSTRWRLIKRQFSDKVPSDAASSDRIWQARFWEHQIRNSADLENHINYIHYNPVKHGYVNRPSNWEYSSIHKYIRADILPVDWGSASLPTSFKTYGER